MRTRVLGALCALGSVGCGGSGGGPANPGVTGGGGKVADYVGTYTGAAYSLPATDPASTIATVTVIIAADGTISGTRHDAGAESDLALAGTISGEGTLSLKGIGSTGPFTLGGSLSKRASGAVATLAEMAPASFSEIARYYVLSGGSATVGAEPLARAKPDSFLKAWAATYRGTWSNLQAGQSGALRLVYAASGRVKGAWTDADGTTRTVSGYLNKIVEASVDAREIVSGRLTLAAKGLAPRSVDVRLTFLAEDDNLAPLPLVGTATDVGGTGSYGISVTPEL